MNSLYFSRNGDFLVAGVGQEHRLGRWWRVKEAKNGWVKIPLKIPEDKQKPDENVYVNGVSESSKHETSVSDLEESEDSAEHDTSESDKGEENGVDNGEQNTDEDKSEEEDENDSESEDEEDNGNDNESEDEEGDGNDSFFLDSKKEDDTD